MIYDAYLSGLQWTNMWSMILTIAFGLNIRYRASLRTWYRRRMQVLHFCINPIQLLEAKLTINRTIKIFIKLEYDPATILKSIDRIYKITTRGSDVLIIFIIETSLNFF